jgi:hypothetical protein
MYGGLSASVIAIANQSIASTCYVGYVPSCARVDLANDARLNSRTFSPVFPESAKRRPDLQCLVFIVPKPMCSLPKVEDINRDV